jgi:hypothetical protein
MSRLVLIVEPSPELGERLVEIARSVGRRAVSRASFEEARLDLAAWAPTTLITNLKLGAQNGIHLVYLAKTANPSAVCVVYGRPEAAFGRDAQKAGAFYERRNFLPFALPRYLTDDLPPADRRDVSRPDRRAVFRGGRRATDIDTLRTVPSFPSPS